MDAFEAFFKSFPKRFNTMEARSQYCEEALRTDRLLCDDPESPTRSVSDVYLTVLTIIKPSQNVLYSPFLLAAMGKHIEAAHGALSVSGLYPHNEKCVYPFAAIGLAAAAVRVVLSSWGVTCDDNLYAL